MDNIYDLEFRDVLEFIRLQKEPEFRSDQIWEGLYHHKLTNWEDFSSLSKNLRKKMVDFFAISNLNPLQTISTPDKQTQKILFQLADKDNIETVLLRQEKRNTLCISTQVGCAVGCVFCATGKLGFSRNLTRGEIIEQILFFFRYLAGQNEKITNIVFMGMGEPLLNYENVLSVIRTVASNRGLNFGARRITISTIGIVPMIIKLADEGLQVNLAVSLHAPDDETRQKLIPINKKFPISEIIKACKFYSSKTSRRITFEFVLIKGVNDKISQARDLSQLIKGIICHVNLIPLNATPFYDGAAPPPCAVRAFGKILLENGIPVSIRDSQGSEIQAGCGQLAGIQLKP